MHPPDKEVVNGHAYITGDSFVTCTLDVNHIMFTSYLFKGLNNFVVIGSANTDEDRYWADNTTVGICASSTWAYFDWIPQLTLCSAVNECITAAGTSSPYHYWSCA